MRKELQNSAEFYEFRATRVWLLLTKRYVVLLRLVLVLKGCTKVKDLLTVSMLSLVGFFPAYLNHSRNITVDDNQTIIPTSNIVKELLSSD